LQYLGSEFGNVRVELVDLFALLGVGLAEIPVGIVQLAQLIPKTSNVALLAQSEGAL